MSLSSTSVEKPVDAEERATEEGESGSAIADGIRRDVRPWLNLVDDLSNLTRDAEISVPQVINMIMVVRVMFLVFFEFFDNRDRPVQSVVIVQSGIHTYTQRVQRQFMRAT